MGIGLSPGDVVVRWDAPAVYTASSPAVYDVVAPSQVLSPAQTPPNGVLAAEVHFDLILNDADTIHVTVPTNASNASAKSTLTGVALPVGPIANDGEFVLTTVTTGGTSYTVRVTVCAADAAAGGSGFAVVTSGQSTVTAANVLTATTLSADATFRLSFDLTNPAGGVGNDPVNVTIFAAETTNNHTPGDLVADLNAVLARWPFGPRLRHARRDGPRYFQGHRPGIGCGRSGHVGHGQPCRVHGRHHGRYLANRPAERHFQRAGRGRGDGHKSGSGRH